MHDRLFAPQLTDQLSGPNWLEKLFVPSVNSALWRRQLAPEIQHFVDTELLSQNLTRTCVVPSASREFQELLPGESAGAVAMRKDVADLCEILAALTDCRNIGARVSTATHPICPRFHTDQVTMRITCTYFGMGTQVAPNHSVERNGTALIHRIPDAIVQASTGDVVFLKGERWPGNQGNGAVHRSPPMLPGESRLLVTLEPV